MEHIQEHFVRIYGAGTGYGESILVNISNKLLIGLDSAIDAISSSRNHSSLFETLTDNHEFVETIWLLSHYHYDHFIALNSLLKLHSKRINSVYLPLEYSKKSFRSLIQLHTLQQTNNAARSKKASDTYDEIRKITNSNDLKFKTISSGRQVIYSDKFTDIKKESRNVRVTIQSISEGMRREILGRNLNSLTHSEKVKMSSKICNYSSYILIVEYGNKTYLFLADAPESRFENINIKDFDLVDFVKISHHGSLTGYNKNFISNFKTKSTKESVAFVTPYSISSLPKDDVIKEYSKAGFKIINSETIYKNDSTFSSILQSNRVMIEKAIRRKNKYVEMNFY